MEQIEEQVEETTKKLVLATVGKLLADNILKVVDVGEILDICQVAIERVKKEEEARG